MPNYTSEFAEMMSEISLVLKHHVRKAKILRNSLLFQVSRLAPLFHFPLLQSHYWNVLVLNVPINVQVATNIYIELSIF